MTIRLLALLVLVFLLARWIARALSAAGRPPPQQQPRPRTGRKQLTACPRCGTHFDPDKGLPAAAGGELVCSPKCRSAPAEPRPRR